MTSNLVSTINLGQSSPLRCLRSPDPAHRRPDLRHDVLASDDFGYPNPSPQRVQFERNDRVQRQPVGAAPPPRIPSFKEALRLASTPSTSATSARSAARWEEPSESRSAAFTGLRLPAPSLPSFTNRRSLAELDLLVAEAESRIRNLELWHATPCPEVPSRFGMKSNLEECIQHAEQSLQLATKRARAIEMLRPTADAPSFASAEVGQRMQLASLRASLAQLELRFERVMSLQPGASPSPAGRPDAALGVRSELSGATSPVSPVNNVASTTNERAPPRAQCAASSRSEEDFRRLEDELQKAKIEIEELRGKNCDLERENERLEKQVIESKSSLKELKDAKAPKVEDMTEKFRQEKAQFQKELEEQKTIVRSLEAQLQAANESREGRLTSPEAEEAEAKTCRDIFDAAEKGALDALRYFLRAAPQRVAQTNGQGQTPLMRAVEKGQLSAAKDLVLIFGAEVNSKDSFGETSLHLLARHFVSGLGRSASIFHVLSAAQIRMDAVNNFRRTALHLAAQFGQGDMAQLLLDAKAPLEVQDDRGRRPLHLAVQFGHSNMVQQLLKAKADVQAKDDTGADARTLAAARADATGAELRRLLAEAAAKA